MNKFLLLVLAFFACIVLHAQEYNYYAGNIHAHSGFSDGNKDAATTGVKTPTGSYAFAKRSEHFDFLGISEHNHSQAKMRLPNYSKGLKQADNSNSDGKFICMYGMEYGVISKGGHVLIYGVEDLIGWENGNYNVECPKSDYNALWDILIEYDGAFATLAHPKSTDFQDLLKNPYNKNADKVICGVAIMTGPAFAENIDYTGKSSSKFVDYFRQLLAQGYHVGPTVDHDNHNLTFGRMASSRTMVLAKKLNRDSIMDAYREMRFYATTDWNMQVKFSINGFAMGQRINTKTNASIKVDVKDLDAADKIATIKLMYGEPGSKRMSTILNTVSNSSTLNFNHPLPKGKVYYYYLEIIQADGDKAYTSPIWVHRLK